MTISRRRSIPIVALIALLMWMSLAGVTLSPSANHSVVALSDQTNVLNLGLNRFADFPSLNPYAPTYVNPIDSELYLRCIATDIPPGPLLELRLCNSWSDNSNYTSYTFNLMPNLKWSDGSALNATDLAESFVLANYTQEFTPVLSTINTVNSTAVTVTMAQSQPNFPEQLENLFIIPNSVFSQVPLANISSFTNFNHILGAGPYVIDNYTTGTNPLIMTPNQYYYQGKPYFDEVVIHIYSSAQAYTAALLAGQLDAQWFGGTGEELAPYQNLSGYSSFVVPLAYAMEPVMLNWLSYPLNNQSFRQALAYSTNRTAIASAVYGPGYTLQTYGMYQNLTSGEPTYNPNATMADQLFTQAGLTKSNGAWTFPNGTKVSLTISFPSVDTNAQNIATLLANQWTAAGIQATPSSTEQATFYASLVSNSWQVAIAQDYGPSYLSCCNFLQALPSAGAKDFIALNGTGQWITSQIGQLVEQFEVLPVASTQAQTLAQQIAGLVAQQVPVIPMYEGTSIAIYNNHLNWGSIAEQTGMFSYQTDTQEPFYAQALYLVRPSGVSNSTSSSSSSSSATTSSSSSSVASSSAIISTSSAPPSSISSSTTSSSSGTLEIAGAIVVVVIVIAAVAAFMMRRGRSAPAAPST
jgi:ABC-type transport system substrate-binding protein